MSRLVRSKPTARVDMGEGDWVEIRTQLTFGEREGLRQKILAGARDANGEVLAERLDHIAANRALMLLALVAWGGPGFCERTEHPHDGECSPVPITAENVDALDVTGERILTEIQERQVTHTANLKAKPNGSSSTGSAPETPGSRSQSGTSSTADSTPSSSASDTAGPGTSS